METQITRQRETSSGNESVVSPPTTPEASFDDMLPVAAESEKATLEAKSSPSSELAANPQLGLNICPQCGQSSLFWNRHDYIYRCVNPECKKQFTLEEYKDKEAHRLLEETQTEQEPAGMLPIGWIGQQEAAAAQIESSESTTAALREAQPAATEPMLLSESITADNVEPGTFEEVLFNEPITEAKEEIEPGAVEELPSNEPITSVMGERGPNAVEQILPNVSAAALKDELERGKIDEIPSNLPTTAVGGGAQAGAKARKRMNRRLVFLIIGVLGVGIIMAGMFLGQKSGEINKLSSQLNESKQALSASQAQLAVAQQDISGLSLQLTQARQEIEALQAQINELRPLTPGEPFVYSGELSGDQTISIPMELKRFERVEGSIAGGLGGLAVYIQDPAGGIVEDLGRVFRSSFIFTAPTPGTYSMIITGSTGLTSSYTVNFTIYSFH